MRFGTILRHRPWQQDPFCGTVFVFRSKRADRVKMLFEGLDWRRVYAPRIRRPQLAG